MAEAAERVLYVSTDYVFEAPTREPYVESDIPAPVQEYGALEAGGRARHRRRQPEPPHRALLVAVRRRREELRRTMLGPAEGREELRVVDDQVEAPTSPGTSPRRSCGLATGNRARDVPRGRSGRVLLVRVRPRDRRASEASACSGPALRHRRSSPARPTGRLTPCSRASSEAPTLPAWQDGLDAYLGSPGVKLLVTGRGRLHRFHLRAAVRGRARAGGARQAHVRRPARERSRRH